MGMGSNRDPHVYYLTADGHVHELAWVNDGGQETTYTVHEPTNAGELIRASISHRGWNHRDVTQAGGSDAAVFSTSPLTAIGTGSNRDPRVYYLDTKYHVHELAWVTTQGGVLPKGSGVTVM
jgi:hypothetical protein